ncbi:MAG: FAD binding domain-containing protein [Gammaproteobacteria bacterium]|nr:FAD binding domain-containing protein [Gammaproteobacteria bacterium]
MTAPFAYVRPRSVAAAISSAAADGAAVHAGGTDLLGCLRDGVYAVDTVVSLADIEGLAGVREGKDGGLAIGAMTTITALAENPMVAGRYPGLAQAAAAVASPQLRHQGTVGGNLCQKPRCWYYRGDFPCLRKGGYRCFAVNGENQHHAILGGAQCFIVHPSDLAPALMALDAAVIIDGPDGTRRVPVAELHVAPADDPTRETVLEAGEIITEVRIPAPPPGLYNSYRKIRTRRSWDFAIAGCALALTLEDDTVGQARVVLAAAAPVPWRATAAEEALRGNPLDEAHIREAADVAMADAVPMTHNAYKVPLFKGMLMEELARARPR